MTPAPPGTGAFRTFADRWRGPIEAALEDLLPAADTPPARLHAAMRYALFPGGKRLRPLLLLLGCRIVGGDLERALRPAAALECVHTYSLVHDDLPCMDDDELRRGRPTCHVAYDEATALLVGDALLTLAFAGVAPAGAAAVALLAQAAGSLGMVGGQMEDLAAERDRGRSLARVEWIHDRKTGALIRAALEIGVLCGSGPAGPQPAVLPLLAAYGDRLGRAFQIVDDCLDLTGSAGELGKNPGADLAHDKLTWPAIVGLDQSLATARSLAEQAAAQAPALVAAARGGRPAQPELDDVVALLQDCALAAVLRRN